MGFPEVLKLVKEPKVQQLWRHDCWAAPDRTRIWCVGLSRVRIPKIPTLWFFGGVSGCSSTKKDSEIPICRRIQKFARLEFMEFQEELGPQSLIVVGKQLLEFS